jgi:hypothetical protein
LWARTATQCISATIGDFAAVFAFFAACRWLTVSVRADAIGESTITLCVLAESRDAELIAKAIVAAAASRSANACCTRLIAETIVVALAGSLAKPLGADLVTKACAFIGTCALLGATVGQKDAKEQKKRTADGRKKGTLEKRSHERILLFGQEIMGLAAYGT